ncbi:YceD family protein [Oricola thermophila]|uniref:DUF177 domain-containing protein n=1 Tax=Oricola thermophila TaxID=2742145 RepID=A0A6N1VBQ8_9HYPH|nr:DUF177 domain-containing protein [Oricola thermophila]QKV18334.1 DUF177 domain-containing protein [Oricola thermophila]
MTGSESDSPISRPVVVSVLPSGGFPVRIEATSEQRAALAEAHALVSVDEFTADLVVKRWRKDGVRIQGTASARIVQACIVSLDPVKSDINVEIDAVFVPEGSRLARPLDDEGALIVDPEGPDLPETFEGGVIDVGAVAEEFFELEIDPYPRAPGVELEEFVGAADDEGEDRSENPFARLAGLRDKL